MKLKLLEWLDSLYHKVGFPRWACDAYDNMLLDGSETGDEYLDHFPPEP